MRFDWAAASDAGQVRAGNEDSAIAVEGLFAVADGMGGHAAGEVASRVAVEALQTGLGDGIVAAVRSANQAVMARADADPSLRGMGTTLCAVALVDGQLQVVNVGDSRAYLFRDGQLVQITEDHNFVAQLEREGRLTAAEARVHPQSNIITRVLGNDPDVEVDLFPVDGYKGDRFLVCSDGLFSELVDDQIAEVLRTHRAPQDAADELVRQANAGGGRDNITVVVVDVLDDDDRSRQASAALAGAAATATSEPIPPPATEAAPRTPRPDDTISVELPPRARRVTWRSVLFLLVLLAIVAAVIGSVWWFGRNTFYVGVDDERVTIFRGRPGGVLWLDPTIEQRTGLDIDDVPAARRRDVEKGRDADSLADARRYVANLREQAEEERAASTTTTTSTTSTTVLPGTATP